MSRPSTASAVDDARYAPPRQRMVDNDGRRAGARPAPTKRRRPRAPVRAPRVVGAGLAPARDNVQLTPTGGGRAQGPPLRNQRRPQAPVRVPRIVGEGLAPSP